MSDPPRQQYVDARRVLLDALVGLQAHLDAFVLVGAQAVYVQTLDRLPGAQPFTTDADLAFDPTRLDDRPLLGDAMHAAGFEYSGQPGIWHRAINHEDQPDHIVPVDLIVPMAVASTTGRRGARLPGDHGTTAAQKTAGVEGALVDNDLLEVAALDEADERKVTVAVAGPAALLVAKAFKLGERLDNPRRLLPKDAGDVFRLYEAFSTHDITERLDRMFEDDRSAEVTRTGLAHLRALFGTPRAPGIRLAIDAMGKLADGYDLATLIPERTQELVADL